MVCCILHCARLGRLVIISIGDDTDNVLPISFPQKQCR